MRKAKFEHTQEELAEALSRAREQYSHSLPGLITLFEPGVKVLVDPDAEGIFVFSPEPAGAVGAALAEGIVIERSAHGVRSGERRRGDPDYQAVVRRASEFAEAEEHVVEQQRSELISARREIGELRSQNEQLRARNESLEARNEELGARNEWLEAQEGKMLAVIGALSAAQRTFAALLTEQREARVILREEFKGEVTRIVGDDVGITFEIDGDLVEHVYHRDQLQAGRAPEVGDQVAAISFLFTRPVPALATEELEKALRDDYSALKESIDDRKIIEPED